MAIWNTATTATYESANAFIVSGNLVNTFPEGIRVRVDCSGEWRYASVDYATYDGADTTVVIKTAVLSDPCGDVETGDVISGSQGNLPIHVHEDEHTGGSNVTGAPPAHLWTGSRLKFRNPDGSWGTEMEVGGLGDHDHNPTGGEIPAATMTEQEVDNAQLLPTLVVSDAEKFLQANETGDGYVMIAVPAAALIAQDITNIQALPDISESYDSDVRVLQLSVDGLSVVVDHISIGNLSEVEDNVALPDDGDTLYANSGNWAKLTIGSEDQVYAVQSGLPAWKTLAPSSSVSVLSDLSDVDSSVSSALADGDLLYGYNGAYVRLPIGPDNKVLMAASGIPSWETVATSAVGNIGDLTDVDDTVTSALAEGDILCAVGSVYTRVEIGSEGKVLTSRSGIPSWDDVVTSSVANIGDLTDVDDTVTSALAEGDMIYASSGAYTRVGIGPENHVLTSKSGVPSWSEVTATATLDGPVSSILFAPVTEPTSITTDHFVVYCEASGVSPNRIVTAYLKFENGTKVILGSEQS